MIQETITQWHIIHFLVTTPTASPAVEDFSSQLSSLQIGGNLLIFNKIFSLLIFLFCKVFAL